METCIGTQAPLVYFEKMTKLFGILFDHIESLETTVNQLKNRCALAIRWEPKVASDMLSKQITALKIADKDTYALEIVALQRAYAEDKVTQEYVDFCQFWQDTLGYHPFLDY
jgi:hypothetical protein